jgi:hypothetical protein
MDIKISVNPGMMDDLPREVMVTTKFEKNKTMDENINVLGSPSGRITKNVDINKVLYSQPSLKKKPTRSYSNVMREDNKLPTKKKISSNDITKMLLTMGKVILI